MSECIIDLPAALTLPNPIGLGANGVKVRLVQGLLSLHGYHTPIDGHFQSATMAAVQAYQRDNNLLVDGLIFNVTFNHLMAPIKKAIQCPPTTNMALSEMILACADQHLAQQPRVVGGKNMGPWVLLYLNGREGFYRPWAGGFVSLVLKQACCSLGIPLPFKTSFSCDLLMCAAKQKGKFYPGNDQNRRRLKPGSLFLVRRSPYEWIHIGIVVEVHPLHFVSIETNFDEGGFCTGHMVCKRTRGYRNKDFIIF